MTLWDEATRLLWAGLLQSLICGVVHDFALLVLHVVLPPPEATSLYSPLGRYWNNGKDLAMRRLRLLQVGSRL